MNILSWPWCHLATGLTELTLPSELGIYFSATQNSVGIQTSQTHSWLVTGITRNSPNKHWNMNGPASYFKTGLDTQTTNKDHAQKPPLPGSLPLKGSKHLVEVWPWWRKDLSSKVWQDGINSYPKVHQFLNGIYIAYYCLHFFSWNT